MLENMQNMQNAKCKICKLQNMQTAKYANGKKCKSKPLNQTYQTPLIQTYQTNPTTHIVLTVVVKDTNQLLI